MVFSSLRFFLFLAGVLSLLAVPMPLRRRKLALCMASWLFYAAWDYRYLALLLLISGIDFVCAERIALTEVKWKRRSWLLFSIVTNLGILGWFKYSGFFLDNLNGLLQLGGHGRALTVMRVFLPAGISFYTFKSMSYTIDVYRRAIPRVTSILDYAMFVSFFPDLIAGPIVRASLFLPQLDREIGPTASRLQSGASLFLIGLGKKLLIADHAGLVADAIFNAPAEWSCVTTWCGVIAYALQIYCDFSGYSDMAIGTARMIGYDLPENFRMPYLATDVADFWRRWHITLSSWLRDYLYIPLGGNRAGGARTLVNLMLTMLLGGLWHGASWNFVLWGLLHGAALVLHRGWRALFPPMPGALSRPLTGLFVILAWVPFRATSWRASMTIFRSLAGLGHGHNVWWPTVMAGALLLVIAGHIFGLLMERQDWSPILRAAGLSREMNAISGPSLCFELATFGGMFLGSMTTLTVFFFGSAQTSPFIYFQF